MKHHHYIIPAIVALSTPIWSMKLDIQPISSEQISAIKDLIPYKNSSDVHITDCIDFIYKENPQDSTKFEYVSKQKPNTINSPRGIFNIRIITSDRGSLLEATNTANNEIRSFPTQCTNMQAAINDNGLIAITQEKTTIANDGGFEAYLWFLPFASLLVRTTTHFSPLTLFKALLFKIVNGLAKTYPLEKSPTILQFSEHKNMIGVGLKNGFLNVYTIDNNQVNSFKTIHTTPITDIKFCCNDTFVISASENDQNFYVTNIYTDVTQKIATKFPICRFMTGKKNNQQIIVTLSSFLKKDDVNKKKVNEGIDLCKENGVITNVRELCTWSYKEVKEEEEKK